MFSEIGKKTRVCVRFSTVGEKRRGEGREGERDEGRKERMEGGREGVREGGRGVWRRDKGKEGWKKRN